MSQPDRFVEFTVRGLAVDPNSKLPILLLQDHGKRVLLPIWIGAFEAGAIGARLEGRSFPRPMTHDLIQKVIAALGGEVLRVDIRALEEGTFYASLVIRDLADREVALDCRPSDGVAVALRAQAPIRVAAEVLSAAQPVPGPMRDEDAADGPRPVVIASDTAARQRLLDELEDMDPEDFGKYKM